MQENNPIVYCGKIKLHGTNGGVNISLTSDGKVQVFAQSRNQFLGKKESEHHGFGLWVHKHTDYFQTIFKEFPDCKTMVIFGEWAGQGIMKGAAICTIPRRIYAVFGILIGESIITSPERITTLLQKEKKYPEEVFVVPFVTSQLPLNFSDSSQLEKPVNEMNTIVESIDKEDPYVKETFQITGPGEGIVWYPISKDNELGYMKFETYSSLVFKTKGLTHSVIRTKRAVQLEPEAAQGVDDFVEMFVTLPRLEQALQEVCKGKAESSQNIGKFVDWILKDIKKEGQIELKQSGLNWDTVDEKIKFKTKTWFMEMLRKQAVHYKEKEEN